MKNIAKVSSRIIFPASAPAFLFSRDTWKSRDEAEEKVYINKREKQMMRKLLAKVEEQEADGQSNAEQFERRVSEIMRRYKIENDALKFQILGLHKEFRE